MTPQQKQQRATELFDSAYTFLSGYFQANGFTTIPAQRVNLPAIEGIAMYMRVTGTATDADMDVMIEHEGQFYRRRDNVLNGVRNEGSWQAIATPTIDDIQMGPPNSVQVAFNTYVAF